MYLPSSHSRVRSLHLNFPSLTHWLFLWHSTHFLNQHFFLDLLAEQSSSLEQDVTRSFRSTNCLSLDSVDVGTGRGVSCLLTISFQTKKSNLNSSSANMEIVMKIDIKRARKCSNIAIKGVSVTIKRLGCVKRPSKDPTWWRGYFSLSLLAARKKLSKHKKTLL